MDLFNFECHIEKTNNYLSKGLVTFPNISKFIYIYSIAYASSKCCYLKFLFHINKETDSEMERYCTVRKTKFDSCEIGFTGLQFKIHQFLYRDIGFHIVSILIPGICNCLK